MSHRDAWRTSALQALLVQLSSAGPCGLLSQPVGWWGCSRSQPQARAHCGEAGGRHRDRAGSKQADLEVPVTGIALGKEHRRLRKKCQRWGMQLQSRWHPVCLVQTISHMHPDCKLQQKKDPPFLSLASIRKPFVSKGICGTGRTLSCVYCILLTVF